MASTVQTTAVALRRGNTNANELFTGVQGELVVDLGADGTGTDVNTTLRLHNAIKTGGIPMARADMANVTSKALGVNRQRLGEKNFAYADLTNIETAANPDPIVNLLVSYGLAKQSYVLTQLESYAKIDMSNVNTVNLATSASGHSGKNLAYSDMSNVNTESLATGAGDPSKHTGKNLAYADLTNVDMTAITSSFATKDLSNVDTDTPTLISVGIEAVANKDNAIDDLNITANHYPTTQAVVDYVAQHSGGGDLSNKMNVNLNNATSWDVLYSDDGSWYKYQDDGEITRAGTGFEVGKDYYTNITLDKDFEPIQVEVTEKTNTGNINRAKIMPEFGTTNLSSHNIITISNDLNGQAQITFSSTAVSGTNLFRYQVTNITMITQGGFEEISYTNEQGVGTVPGLFIKAVTVNSSGGITSYKYKPEEGSLDIDGDTFTISSGASGSITAIIKGSALNVFPSIGGAALVKGDLTNLAGMSDSDAMLEHGSDWRIRHDVAIPTSPLAADSIEYYRIATAGLVADAIATEVNKYKPKQGTAAPTTSTTGRVGQIYVDTTNGDGYLCVSASGSTYTWKQITV